MATMAGTLMVLGAVAIGAAIACTRTPSLESPSNSTFGHHNLATHDHKVKSRRALRTIHSLEGIEPHTVRKLGMTLKEIRVLLLKQMDISCEFSSLCDDILIEIISYLSPQQAWQLAKTCRRAYATALPYFLSHVTVKNDMEAVQLCGFCSFIDVDVEHRAALMKSLQIGRCSWRDLRYPPYLHIVPQLANVLHHAINLTEITLLNADKVFNLEPCFAILVRMRGLEVVHLENFGELSLRFLAQSFSKPRRLTLGNSISSGYHKRLAESAFQNYAHSLEMLHLSHVGPLVKTWLKYTADVLPHVQELKLTGMGFAPRLSQLSRRFPNVQSLDLDFKSSAEESHNLYWKILDHFTVSTPFRHFLCSVRHLELNYDVFPYNDLQTRALLEQTCPVVLTCSLTGFMTDSLSLISAAAPSLKYMEIEMSTRILRDLDVWATSLARNLSSLPLVGISIFSYHISTRSPDSVAEHKFARTLACAIPSLQYVGMYISHKRTDMRWYCVESRGRGKILLKKILAPKAVELRQQLLNTPRV